MFVLYAFIWFLFVLCLRMMSRIVTIFGVAWRWLYGYVFFVAIVFVVVFFFASLTSIPLNLPLEFRRCAVFFLNSNSVVYCIKVLMVYSLAHSIASTASRMPRLRYAKICRRNHEIGSTRQPHFRVKFSKWLCCLSYLWCFINQVHTELADFPVEKINFIRVRHSPLSEHSIGLFIRSNLNFRQTHSYPWENAINK